MSAGDWTISVGALTMGPATSYSIIGLEGLGSPDIRSTDSPRPQQHGDFRGYSTYASRTVTISVLVRGDGDATCFANYNALMAAWQLGGTADTQLTVQVPGRAAMALLGECRRVAADDLSRLKTGTIAVTLEFYSEYSSLFSAASNDVTVGIGTITTGRTYSYIFPMSYGGGGAGIQTVNNAGNTEYAPLVKIYGPCTNPIVENITAGKAVSFSIVLGVGDVLWVDMDSRTVLLGGTASRRSALLPGSAFWTLGAGANQIRFTATSGPGSYAVVTARDAWVG